MFSKSVRGQPKRLKMIYNAKLQPFYEKNK